VLLHGKNNFAERSKILLENNSENNFVGTLNIISNTVKNFDIVATSFYIIIFIVQQNYVSDLYPAEILDLSAKPFFPCRILIS